MFLSLRMRLFASYLLLLLVALSIIVVALLLILNSRPAPAQQTYQQLAAVAQSLDLRDVIEETGLQAPRTLLQRRTELENQLAQFAQERGVRVLVTNLATGAVQYDSASRFDNGSSINIREEAYVVPSIFQRGLLTRVSLSFGHFADTDSSDWLYVSLQPAQPTISNIALLLAEPPQSQSLQAVLAQFGEELALPVVQSALVGLLVAIGLAMFISRGIIQPLKVLAKAVRDVAEGYYNQKVPLLGPSELRAVAEAFNHMSEQVQASQRSQQDFMANVSHDLKTPLTSIQGYSQAIMDGVSDPIQAANIIHEEAGRLNRMVVELTDLARLQAGRLSMRSTAIDIGQITAAVGRRLAIVAKEKGVALDVQAAHMPEIAGDGDRLAQVLTNLISNAINYTPSGGCITVKNQVNAGGVEVMVEDTGIGIAAQDLGRIFERFYQVDKARGPKRGTGLGLAIVREIVHAHGGKITAASAGEGKGSTFTVWLPSPQLSTIVRGRK